MTELAIAVAAFVLSHFILSHPLRAPLAARIGERGFLGLYSLVALATLIWAGIAYGDAPTRQLWISSLWALPVAHAAMLAASILLAGSLITPGPALPMAGGKLRTSTDPKGVAGITRHPMMWAFALWAAVHIMVSGRLELLILAGGIGVLALAGARLQDARKAALLGEGWAAYATKTSYWPFGAQVSGRLPWAKVWPGAVPVVAGLALFALLTYLHPLVFGISTGLV